MGRLRPARPVERYASRVPYFFLKNAATLVAEACVCSRMMFGIEAPRRTVQMLAVDFQPVETPVLEGLRVKSAASFANRPVGGALVSGVPHQLTLRQEWPAFITSSFACSGSCWLCLSSDSGLHHNCAFTCRRRESYRPATSVSASPPGYFLALGVQSLMPVCHPSSSVTCSRSPASSRWEAWLPPVQR